jgi:hypothetical protein
MRLLGERPVEVFHRHAPGAGDRQAPLRQESPAARRRGGSAGARELFDTLLLWKGRIALDGEGRAVVEVPLNDS